MVLSIPFPGCSRVVTVYLNNNVGTDSEIYQIMTHLCQRRNCQGVCLLFVCGFLISCSLLPPLSSRNSPFKVYQTLHATFFTLSCTSMNFTCAGVHDLPSNSPSSPLSQKLPGEVIMLLNMNERREGAVYIPFNFCVLLSRWLNMIVLAVMSLIRGYFPSARLTVELCCSSGVHTAAGHHLLI